MQKPSIPKGTRDFSPSEIRRRNFIFDIIKSKFEKFGFSPIETPSMEKLSSLTGKYGSDGDQLLFKVLKRGAKFEKAYSESNTKTVKDNDFSDEALRYDLTVPFARYVVQHQNEITFSLAYAFTENFMLPLSHDEVVYGKKSILGRMPGDEWQRFANLRLLYGYMFTHPGTKLLFMGGEFGQSSEWDFEGSLDWNLLEFKSHKNLQNYFKSLNTFYKTTPALFEKAFSGEGFEWISYDDHQNSVISYIRKGYNQENNVVVVCNLTPRVHEKYHIGLSVKGKLSEVFNSDAEEFGGSGVSNKKPITIKKQPWNGREYVAEIVLPPLGICIFSIKP